MNWKRKYTGILLTGIILLSIGILLVGGRDGNQQKPIKMIYIAKIMGGDSDFYKLLMNGARMAAEEHHIQLEIVAPNSEEEYEEQNRLIAEAIEKKPDAILLSASNYTETTDMAKQIKENEIKLVLIDSGVDENVQDTFVETDNIRAGEQIGRYMQELVTKNGQVAIVGHTQNSSTARDRETGIRQGFGQDEKIVDVIYCDSDYEKAEIRVEKLLEKYSDIDLLVGTNEYAMVGAARAIKRMGLSDKIRIVGIDSSLEAIKMMEAGVISGFVVQNPFKMGYMGVEAAVKAVYKETVLPHIDTGSTLITRDNMYSEENQKLLFLFDGE